IWFDPFPLTALEAQVTGCPAVAFDVGGLREGIRDGETGLVLTDISEEALYQALDSLLSNPNRLALMSKRAIETARPYFTWERVASEITSYCIGQVAKENPSVPLALLSPWADSSDYALYAAAIVDSRDIGSSIILSPHGCTTEHSVPCWSVEDFSSLSQVCRKYNINTLHINIDLESVNLSKLTTALQQLHTQGISLLFTHHKSVGYSTAMEVCYRCFDTIIVHSYSAKLEVIALGVDSASVHVEQPGLKSSKDSIIVAKQQIFEGFGFETSSKLLFIFGELRPEHQLEAVLEAMVILESGGIHSSAIIVTEGDTDNLHAQKYREDLEAVIEAQNFSKRVQFQPRPAQDTLESWFHAADLVMINTPDKSHGSAHVCGMALAAGALVATSTSPLFSPFQGAVWRMTSGYQPGTSAYLLLTQPELRDAIQGRAQTLVQDSPWEAYSAAIYGEITVEENSRDTCSLSEDSTVSIDLQRQLEQAEQYVQEKRYAEAHRLFEALLNQNNKLERAWRGNGATFVAEGNYYEASTCFEQALKIDPHKVKTLCGLGLCHTRLENFRLAKPYLLEALSKDITMESSLIQLLEVSYALGEFDDLIEVLYRFVAEYPASMDMRYCLAGALFKQGNFAAAREMLKEIQIRQPEHEGAQELLNVIQEAQAGTNASRLAATIEKEAQTKDKDSTVLQSAQTTSKAPTSER
ncbi:MAG: glycosyltransferase, partial [Bdellovibrionales bacterium]|nr:glycosyltransferase [Bdellovibrionales bacterium]